MRVFLALLALSVPASAQIASESFDAQNTDAWGVEFGAAAPHEVAGGNPGGRILVSVQSSASNLPAAMIVPGAATHPWGGNLRALGATEFRFDRQVELGSSNFGTRLFVVLGNDGGTQTDFSDDAWAFFDTADVFQFGMTPWATIATAIPSASTTLPAGWDVWAFPANPLSGLTDDDVWDGIVQDVDYIGIAMGRPWNGGAWFGAHQISLDNIVLEGPANPGSSYCGPAELNAGGLRGRIFATGSAVAADNDLTLHAEDLVTNQFGIFVTSRTTGFVPAGTSSNGNLCLGGSIGRFTAPSQILSTGQAASFELAIDLNQMPQGAGFVAAAAGETWYFQAWHREPVGLGSNFTDGLELTFQ